MKKENLKNINGKQGELYASSITRLEVKKEILKDIKGISSYNTTDLSVSQLTRLLNTSINDLKIVENWINEIKVIKPFVKDKDEKSELVKIETDLKAIKKEIEIFNNNSSSIVEVINDLDVELSKSYNKLRHFNEWETPITRKGEDLFTVDGFSKNCTVLLDTRTNDIQISVAPLPFKSKKQQEHFFKLCYENEDTVLKEVKAWLKNVKYKKDLLNIIKAQQAIEKEKTRLKNFNSGDKLLSSKSDYFTFKSSLNK